MPTTPRSESVGIPDARAEEIARSGSASPEEIKYLAVAFLAYEEDEGYLPTRTMRRIMERLNRTTETDGHA